MKQKPSIKVAQPAKTREAKAQGASVRRKGTPTVVAAPAPIPAPDPAPTIEEPRVRGRRARRDVELEGLKQMSLVWLWVADLRASVVYYRELIGLKLTYLDEQSGWAFFSTGAESVDLGLQVWPFGGSVPRGGGACPVLEVVNLTLAREALAARGVQFEGETIGEEGVRRHATFHDPDGNPIMLTQVW